MTGLFSFLEPRNSQIDEFCGVKKRESTDVAAQRMWKMFNLVVFTCQPASHQLTMRNSKNPEVFDESARREQNNKSPNAQFISASKRACFFPKQFLLILANQSAIFLGGWRAPEKKDIQNAMIFTKSHIIIISFP